MSEVRSQKSEDLSEKPVLLILKVKPSEVESANAVLAFARDYSKVSPALFENNGLDMESIKFADAFRKVLIDAIFNSENNPNSGIELIAQERRVQIEKHRWSDIHDDGHDWNELAKAAACYALPDHERASPRILKSGTFQEYFWPWKEEYFKPSPDNRIKELAKAGALIAAEIDRIQRISK